MRIRLSGDIKKPLDDSIGDLERVTRQLTSPWYLGPISACRKSSNSCTRDTEHYCGVFEKAGVVCSGKPAQEDCSIEVLPRWH
jgi:hypothetical protein